MEINKENDKLEEKFDDDFEVIYEGELPVPDSELGNDAYKDVLASLAELDETGAMDIDYLEANKTRTIDFPDTAVIQEKMKQDTLDENEKKEEKPGRKKDNVIKIFCAVVLVLVFLALIFMANSIR